MKDIVLYSTGCPRCNVLKAKLKNKDIQYTECNDTKIMLEKGITEVPVLYVNGFMMSFKQATEWVNKQ